MHIVSKTLVASLLLAGTLVSGVALAKTAKPADPQPSPAPGLAVSYVFQLVRHLDEIVPMFAAGMGEKGDPLPALNWAVGGGNVLTTTQSDGVAAHITGFIKLSEAGKYGFAAQSNDGVRVTIGGVEVAWDPDVHSDRFTEVIDLDVPVPGWYPIEVFYFERKSTSTLELYWQPPSAQDMAIVPADAFGQP